MFEAFEIRDVITICISVAALALSYYTAMRASRLNRRQYELAKAQGEEGSRIAAASAEAAREQARMQRDSDIIAWAGEVSDLLSEMGEFSIATGDVSAQIARRHELRHRLSAKIDLGRLFFPNSCNITKPWLLLRTGTGVDKGHKCQVDLLEMSTRRCVTITSHKNYAFPVL